MKQNQTWSFFGGVFLACACVMALQILQSRIFSVVTWYHLSFLVISIAMFGLTLGALNIYRGNEEEQRRNLPALLFAIRILLFTGLIMPCSVLLGYAFLTGMRMTGAVAPRMTAWFWGINGACGVVASSLAVLIGIGLGLNITLLLGGLLYALLIIPALKLLNFSKGIKP